MWHTEGNKKCFNNDDDIRSTFINKINMYDTTKGSIILFVCCQKNTFNLPNTAFQKNGIKKSISD